MPAYLLLPVLVDWLGRKPIFALSQIVPGLFCLIAAFLQPGTVHYAFLVLFSKFGTAAALNLCFLYTAELYPTTVRNSAIGTCSAIGRLGGVLAPWVGKFLPNQGYYPQYVTLCLFGGFAVLSGICALQLPETIGHHLPRNFDDVEVMKKETKQLWTWCTSSVEEQESERLLK